MPSERPPLPALQPDWPAPPGVGSLMSTREGGVGVGPWRSLNLGLAAGDDPAAVAENRSRLKAALGGAEPVFLRQVHGARVLRIVHADAAAPPQDADASVTSEPGVACCVLVADCLPVLLAARDGSAVAAAHAGWRGLAGGVLEATLAALCEAAACPPGELLAWLGPCIGPRRFEVGADVLAAFGADAQRPDPVGRFVPRRREDGTMRWLADLRGLAADRLRAAGVSRLSASDACTVEDASRFFSFRRDGVTGRMAAAVWRRA